MALKKKIGASVAISRPLRSGLLEHLEKWAPSTWVGKIQSLKKLTPDCFFIENYFHSNLNPNFHHFHSILFPPFFQPEPQAPAFSLKSEPQFPAFSLKSKPQFPSFFQPEPQAPVFSLKSKPQFPAFFPPEPQTFLRRLPPLPPPHPPCSPGSVAPGILLLAIVDMTVPEITI